MPRPDSTPPLGESISEIVDRTTKIVHEEIELAKAEISVALQDLLRGSVAGIVGGVFAFFGLFILLIAFSFLIADAIGILYPWLGFFIVAFSCFLIGGVLAAFALKKIKKGSQLTPTQAIEEAMQTKTALQADPSDAAQAIDSVAVEEPISSSVHVGPAPATPAAAAAASKPAPSPEAVEVEQAKAEVKEARAEASELELDAKQAKQLAKQEAAEARAAEKAARKAEQEAAKADAIARKKAEKAAKAQEKERAKAEKQAAKNAKKAAKASGAGMVPPDSGVLGKPPAKSEEDAQPYTPPQPPQTPPPPPNDPTGSN